MGLVPHKRDNRELSPFLPCCEHNKKMAIYQSGSWLFNRYQICQHHHLGSSLQNCEKKTLAVYKPPSLWNFFISAWRTLRLHPNSFHKTNKALLPKSGKDSTPTKLQANVTQILMWNLNNILANRIKDYIKNKKRE